MDAEVSTADDEEDAHGVVPHIAFENAPHPRSEQKALYVPSPREREQGQVQHKYTRSANRLTDLKGTGCAKSTMKTCSATVVNTTL